MHWTATELLSHHFEDPPWVVPGLIPVGLTMLAGRPKIGKSMLSLQVALAHATGGRVLDREASRGKVLYLRHDGDYGLVEPPPAVPA